MTTHSQPDGIRNMNPVISTGIFDGVHLGHQKLIQRLVLEAKVRHVPSMIVTFWPHPHVFFHPDDKDFRLLMSLEEKEARLKELGIDEVVVLPFNQELARMSAEDFVRDVIVGRLGASFLLVGDDHRFGKNREGSIEDLKILGSAMGFDVADVGSELSGDKRISSTFIRTCLSTGDLASANKLLGYPFFIIGKVVEGNRIGSKIGFPTANISCCHERKQIPQEGVYVVKVDWSGSQFGGMLNIGTRPTIENTERMTIEVHIFGHEGELYGETLRIQFLMRLRDEMRFNNLDELRSQLALDKKDALEILNKT